MTVNSPKVYPIWWDTSITVYNKYEDITTGVITWYKTILHNNFWKNSHSKVNVGQTVLESNTIIVRVPENSKFLEFGEWINTPNNEMSNYFTFNDGDIIIKGEVDDIINEYENGHRSTDLIDKYKSRGQCLQVNVFQNNTGTGKGSPHYYIGGI